MNTLVVSNVITAFANLTDRHLSDDIADSVASDVILLYQLKHAKIKMFN